MMSNDSDNERQKLVQEENALLLVILESRVFSPLWFLYLPH